jgi:hypothetical protein
MKRVRFIPPTYDEYLDRATIRRIRKVVKDVFKKAKPDATPTLDPSPFAE